MVGYGDIGQTCARLARVFGMRILAMRRRTDLSESERDSGLKVSHHVSERLLWSDNLATTTLYSR